MEWVPFDSVVVVNFALPLLSVPVPKMEEPFLKMTVPLGVPPDLTVAVKVTDSPNFEGFSEEASEVELAAFFTVCVRVDELVRKSVLPL